jgi:RND family efflux transporter MFP subunit
MLNRRVKSKLIAFTARMLRTLALSIWVAGSVATYAADASAPVPVTTAMLSDVVFFPSRTAPATSISLNDTDISAEISGQLTEIAVRVGDVVDKSALLASLDCRDYEIAVAKAEAAYNAGQAKIRFDREQLEKARQLAKQKNISKEELDRRASNASISAAELEGLKAERESAQLAVSKCTLSAPFKAVVVERLANLGDFLERGSPVVRLLDEENIEVRAMIQDQDLDSLAQAKNPRFVSRKQTYPVVLRTILPVVDSRLRSYEVRLSFVGTNPPAGTAGRLEWTLKQPHIRAELLVHRDALGLFVEREGVAVFVPVDGAREGQPSPVDLPQSEKIIVDGRYGVRDGDAVRVVEP